MEREAMSLFEQLQTEEKPRTMSENVADQINTLILQRNIRAGDQLPSEYELTQILQVGRGTVREAIKLLVARNVLEIRRGKGTFVTLHPGELEDPLGFAYVPDQVRLAEDLLEIRMRMEPWIASLAAERITDGEKVRLQAKCQKVTELIRNGQSHTDADQDFHKYIAKCSHNEVMPRLIPVIMHCITLVDAITNHSLLEMTVRTHQAIANAICGNDPKLAEEEMCGHIRSNIDRIRELKSLHTCDMEVN